MSALIKKVCSLCKEEKISAMFNKDKRMKDGYHSQCKECRKNSRLIPKITEEITTIQRVESVLHDLLECQDTSLREVFITKIRKYVDDLEKENKSNNDNSFTIRLSDIGFHKYTHNSIVGKITERLLNVGKIVGANEVITVDKENGSVLVIMIGHTITNDEKNRLFVF